MNEAKLSKDLDSIREKSLPTSVFIEIMAHFRDDSSRFSEYEDLKFQIGSSSDGEYGGRRKLPYVYTEQGIAMLSAMLRSEIAIQVSIQIMKTFVELRRYLANGAFLLEKVNDLEIKQIESDRKRADFVQKTNKRLEEVFDYIAAHEESNQKIFFDGQIFDAFSLMTELIQQTEKNIILIDEEKGYHIGASLKDTGKKCFGINKIEDIGVIKDILHRAELTS